MYLQLALRGHFAYEFKGSRLLGTGVSWAETCLYIRNRALPFHMILYPVVDELVYDLEPEVSQRDGPLLLWVVEGSLVLGY